MEYQLKDRLSSTRFLGLSIGDCAPNAKTIRLFREQLGELDLVKKLFGDFNHYLAKNGFEARKGQNVDACICRSSETTQQQRRKQADKEWGYT